MAAVTIEITFRCTNTNCLRWITGTTGETVTCGACGTAHTVTADVTAA